MEVYYGVQSLILCQNVILLNLYAVWSKSFALCHALLKLVCFHKSGHCKIHSAMGMRSYVFPDGLACAYKNMCSKILWHTLVRDIG